VLMREFRMLRLAHLLELLDISKYSGFFKNLF
jgi:hypothetical protein